MNTVVKLAMLGRNSTAVQLDEGHRVMARKHNKEVDKNRQLCNS